MDFFSVLDILYTESVAKVQAHRGVRSLNISQCDYTVGQFIAVVLC